MFKATLITFTTGVVNLLNDTSDEQHESIVNSFKKQEIVSLINNGDGINKSSVVNTKYIVAISRIEGTEEEIERYVAENQLSP